MHLRLTRKELEVMDLMAQGRRDKEIGEILGVSAHTVRQRVFIVCTKLGATTRVQAALMLAGKA